MNRLSQTGVVSTHLRVHLSIAPTLYKPANYLNNYGLFTKYPHVSTADMAKTKQERDTYE